MKELRQTVQVATDGSKVMSADLLTGMPFLVNFLSAVANVDRTDSPTIADAENLQLMCESSVAKSTAAFKKVLELQACFRVLVDFVDLWDAVDCNAKSMFLNVKDACREICSDVRDEVVAVAEKFMNDVKARIIARLDCMAALPVNLEQDGV